MGGLEGLDHRAQPDQRVAKVGPLVAAVLPGAPGRLAQLDRAARPQRADSEGASSGDGLALALKTDDHQAPSASMAQTQVAVKKAWP